MAQYQPLITALFHAVSVKGDYLKANLSRALLPRQDLNAVSDPEALAQAIDQLCLLSDLFQYDDAAQLLTTSASYQPLNQAVITAALPLALQDKIAVKCTFITGSTNADLAQQPLAVDTHGFSNNAAIAVAEMQEGGRGRREKNGFRL